MNGGMVRPSMACKLLLQGGQTEKEKIAAGKLKHFQGLILGIYQVGVSLTGLNPASPEWPAMVVKALACQAAQIAAPSDGKTEA